MPPNLIGSPAGRPLPFPRSSDVKPRAITFGENNWLACPRETSKASKASADGSLKNRCGDPIHSGNFCAVAGSAVVMKTTLPVARGCSSRTCSRQNVQPKWRKKTTTNGSDPKRSRKEVRLPEESRRGKSSRFINVKKPTSQIESLASVTVKHFLKPSKPRRVLELFQRFLLDLPDAFSGDLETLCHLFQGVWLTVR